MALPLPEGSHLTMRALRFIDVLEDSDPTKLSWTKIGVAFTTLLNMMTAGTAAVREMVGDVAHTDFGLLGMAAGLHVVTKGAHEIKRYTEKS